MDIYKGKGKFVRYRNLEYVLKEMEQLVARYDARSFYISDEMFTLNKRRAIDFCTEYGKKIKKPFMVQTRADHIDAHLARALSDAGCFMVNMAIESGNEVIRNSILKKGVSSELIYNAYKAVRDHGMMSSSFNMIGVPGETVETIRDTIEMNRNIKPNRVLCSIFMPLPGTELGEYCKENDLIKDTISTSTNYYSHVVVKNPDISARTLIGYQGFFDWYILLPKWLHGFVHLLRIIYQSIIPVEIPANPILRKLREVIVETVYQSKRYLPQKSFHVKTR